MRTKDRAGLATHDGMHDIHVHTHESSANSRIQVRRLTRDSESGPKEGTPWT